jgi:hypothetical protein
MLTGRNTLSAAPRDESASPLPPVTAERKPSAAERKSAAASTLEIWCDHNFRSATLEIFSDENLLLQTTLHGHEVDYGAMKIYEGTYETSKPIAPGHHILRVRVTSRRDDYSEEGAISGTFAENGLRTLAIEFGKGSALHVVSRKLALSWR